MVAWFFQTYYRTSLRRFLCLSSVLRYACFTVLRVSLYLIFLYFIWKQIVLNSIILPISVFSSFSKQMHHRFILKLLQGILRIPLPLKAFLHLHAGLCCPSREAINRLSDAVKQLCHSGLGNLSFHL